jgi:thimet oligopeptidase
VNLKRFVFVLTLALFAAPLHAAPAKPAAAPTRPNMMGGAPTQSIDAPDNAPFWTGHPDVAMFSTREANRLTRAKAAIARLKAVKAPRTVLNTLVPFDEAARQLDMAGSQAGLISQVSPDSLTRVAAEKAIQDISAFGTELSLDHKVYEALQAIDVSKADAETQFYVKRTLRDFRLAGVDKDDATRAKIRSKNDEIVLAGQAFSRNIRDDHSKITCTVAELDGLPADYIARHKPAADGTITLTTEYPDAVPVFNFAKNADLRKRMFIAYNNRAYPKNIAALDTLRIKRHELALILGYSNFADLVTADKMVGSAANAHAFIDRVVAASDERQAREYQQLLKFKQETVPGATTVDFWDASFLREQLRRAQYNFDSQSIRPYFPYNGVKDGVLSIASKLFDVTFKRVPDAPVWDKSVECYELYDGGKLAGRFYLDMHPRPNKYNHAAQFDIRCGLAGRQIPEAALVCNLPEPTKDDPAALCDYNDVNTFFHEFGHLLHNMFAGRHRWVGTGGIKTEQDFVEAPSQMLEEWMKNPEVLASFAKDYKTGTPIPAELVNQMNRANSFGKGLDVRRQMVYAGTSLGCYDRDPSSISTDDLMAGMVKRYQPFPYVDGTHFQCAFGHLDGYSAVYYTYMWSLVIAKDMFAQFDQNHLLAPGVAKRYREAVLAPGGSKPAAQLVHDFLGRDFNEQAWKKWLDSDH